MPNPVTIEFNGDPSDLLADIQKLDSNFDKLNDQLLQTAIQSSNAAQKSTKSWTEFRSMYSSIVDIARTGKQVFDATFGRFQEYAKNVRELAISSNTSAQEASKLIQVLDDFGVTAQDISNAARTMKEKGLVPTVETLADLADQFNAIQDPAERLKFAQDNLGRSYQDYLNVLSKGGDVLRENADQINQNLILTDEAVRKAELEGLALDELADSWDGLKIKTGAYFGQLILTTSQHKEVIERLKEQGIQTYRGIEYTQVYKDELKKLEDEQLATARATEQNTEATGGLTESQQEAEETAKRLSSVYSGLLSSMFSIQKENDAYQKTVEDITEKDADLAAKKNQLILKMNEEKEAGKLTNDQYMNYVQQLAEVTKAQEENKQALEDAAKDQEKASKQRVFDLVSQKLAADGVVSSGEYEYQQNLAVSYGLVSRAAADQAISEEKRADALVSSFEQTLPPAERSLQVLSSLAALSGTVVDFKVNFSSNVPQNYKVPGASYSSFNPQASPGGYGYHPKKRDSGGAGIAGEMYMIGKGAQPEAFVPSTNGTFVPNADKKMGNTYNIVIHNPKKETAENSMREALMKISYWGGP